MSQTTALDCYDCTMRKIRWKISVDIPCIKAYLRIQWLIYSFLQIALYIGYQEHYVTISG